MRQTQFTLLPLLLAASSLPACAEAPAPAEQASLAAAESALSSPQSDAYSNAPICVTLAAAHDSYVTEAKPNTSWGKEDALDRPFAKYRLRTGAWGTGNKRAQSVLRFDLNELQDLKEQNGVDDHVLTSATLRLVGTASTDDFTAHPLSLSDPLQNWGEQHVTWHSIGAGTASHFDATVDGISATSAPFTAALNRYALDLTDWTQEWSDGSRDNDGVMIKMADDAASFIEFRSSEWSNPDARPGLEICYQRCDPNSPEIRALHPELDPWDFGTEDNPYLICNIEQLQAIETGKKLHQPGGSWPTGTSATNTNRRDRMYKHYRVVADIDASATSDVANGLVNQAPCFKIGNANNQNNPLRCKGFKPLGAYDDFSGTFDGGGHEIVNLHIDRTGSNDGPLGLFGETRGATLKNISLVNASVKGEKTVGSLVGWAMERTLHNQAPIPTTITNCTSTGTVTCTPSYTVDAYGNLDDHDGEGYQGGGLVGYLSDSTIEQSSTATTVSCDLQAGGLVGEVSRSYITNSYADGAVNGIEMAGGLVGLLASDSTITNSYAAGTVTQTWRKTFDVYTPAGYTGDVPELPMLLGILADSPGPGTIGALVGKQNQSGASATIINSYASSTLHPVQPENTLPLCGDVAYGEPCIEFFWTHQYVESFTGLVGMAVDANYTELTGANWGSAQSGDILSDNLLRCTPGLGTFGQQCADQFPNWDANIWDFGNHNDYPMLTNNP